MPRASRSASAAREDLAARSHLVLVCPRYEGVDERIRGMVDLELSIGDFVLTGGELPALVVCDAVLRLLPGAIEPGSLVDESFASGLLEYPQYTRPAIFEGIGVPEILTSGDHGAVRRWRLRESLRRTLERRPDLLEGRSFSAEEARLLDEVVEERDGAGHRSGSPWHFARPGRPAVRAGGACYTPPSVALPRPIHRAQNRGSRDRPGRPVQQGSTR